MLDREKVVKGLYQHCEGSMFDRCGECPYYAVDEDGFFCRDEMLNEALALLKEQDEIVRCKDCKHRTRRICNNIEFWECNHIRYELAKCGVTDDWFCADGERR